MRRSGWAVLFATFALIASLPATAGDNQPAITTTICELVASPQQFHGKLVQVRAIAQKGAQTSLLRDDTCSAFLWFAVPDAAGTRGKDREIHKLIGYLDKKVNPKERPDCPTCAAYKVTTTIIGRFEYTRKGEGDPPGFGYLNSYDSQFVLQTVSEVVAEPLDRRRL
jgi:hypothetical protein